VKEFEPFMGERRDENEDLLFHFGKMPDDFVKSV
jgi:hypothetical protein